jgi:hypothetical protein
MRIGSITIDFGTLERWRKTSVIGESDENGAFTRCRRAELRRRPPTGECDASFRKARAAALDYLAALHGMLLEAERIEVFVLARPPRNGSAAYARSLGFSRSDVRLLARAAAAEDAIVEHLRSTLPEPSEAALVRAWRRQRGGGFFTSRQRRVEVLELPTRAAADEAITAVRAGESFIAVGVRLAPRRDSAFHGDAQIFSDAVAPSSSEDFLSDEATVEELPAALERALFGAPIGELRGPIETTRAFFVLRVVEIVTERARRPLAQVRAPLAAALKEARLSSLIVRREAEARRRWRARTTCDRRIAVRSVCGRVVPALSR